MDTMLTSPWPTMHRLILLFCVALIPLTGAEMTATTPRLVLLKLDDVVADKAPAKAVAPNWERITRYLETRRIKASFGIICESLDSDKPLYTEWIKTRIANGYIEFWNHGYLAKYPVDKATGRKSAFDGPPLDEQLEHLRKGQQLFQDKIGLPMRAFGPHAGKLDATAYQALDQIPEIELVWFYHPPKDYTSSKIVIQRVIELEKPIFAPNLENFRSSYAALDPALTSIAMQGHPANWNDERWGQFTAIIDFLIAQGCTFITPSEYLAQRRAAQQP
jgi:peptidoglycan/xylan/chitin deacetylase (PgdA/CDA1 family)